MASLRDVLDHIGKRVRLERADESTVEGLALVREPEAFAEAKLEPKPGDVLVVLETDRRYRVESSEAELVRGRVDHYKLRIIRA